MTQHAHLARLKKRLEARDQTLISAADALVKEMRRSGASDDRIVQKLREVFGELAEPASPTLADAIAKSLRSPGTVVDVDDDGVRVTDRNQEVATTKSGLPRGRGTWTPGAATTRKSVDEDGLAKARKQLEKDRKEMW